MNITDLLQLLTESREVEDINEKLKGKVDARVLDTLGSLMKKGKYDNIAMAIFDALQEWTDEEFDEKRDFLIKRPRLVYAALKEAGKGNSNFNPELELRHFRFDEEEPMKYWAAYRSDEKKHKEKQKTEKKITFGLPQARVKELPKSFIFFPRNFKLDFDNLTFNVNDLNKQYEDLRALSQQMADRDTGSDWAKKNHWCVASSDSAYYSGKMYKGGHPGGLFMIIVNKNEDGSPNWNDRWLLWVRPDGKWEFANKFNQHNSFKYSLPESTVDFIENKVIARLGGAKGDKNLQAIKDRAKNVYWSKDDKKRINVQSPIFKNYIKILRFLRAKYNERHGDAKTNGIMNTVKEAFNKALNWVDGKTQSTLANGEIVVPAGEYTFKFKRHDKVEERKGGELIDLFLIQIFRKGDNKDAAYSLILDSKEFKQVAADPMAIKKIKPWSYKEILSLDPSFKSKAYILTDPTPSKKVRDALLNNKLALQYYEEIATENEPTVANEEIHEFFIGPRFLITVMEGDNRISVLDKPWSLEEEDAELIGDLRDKDIVDKVKKAYADLVAEGPEKA